MTLAPDVSIMTPQSFMRLNTDAHLQKKVSLEIFLQLTSILPRSLYNKLFYRCNLQVALLVCPLLTFAFSFITFARWLQNFGFFQTDSKFQNFTLIDGESFNSQYHSYPDGGIRISAIFSLPLFTGEGFEPSITRLWAEFCTAVLMDHKMFVTVSHFYQIQLFWTQK